ncbi:MULTISPECIES: ABC transporter permease [Sporomusa]|jgi:NitT/TauT family transport system permease protein|uniref:Aliphatic sulfonates transport permease protein SsuC n=1 Tax=Sporomusa sphaeroides DSM 2875 TaxID=1337886 RepID=A0ABP2C6U5_9FIRM|nr:MULTISPECIES: ABC transporter permease [Sporomusa]MCM0759320.1 ABC transporter permease [Sporomusa sphaeroides DSM 2875]OLS58645.1 putative aliphatic sulfonates transport permease protein SsuC [Sporomusa sphaeroides DSM 2875]CVK19845.1 Putative aliphatic sulfonates transport permease protein SsuC [Sporomusa sphaeroides DSM 2875]HML35309.1 ABC transporter permease [Sporomusa sphaeroides]
MKTAISILSPLTLLFIWEIAARAGFVDTRLLSSPSLILQAFFPLLISGDLIYNTWVSVLRVIWGFLAGAIPGILLGMSMGLSPFVRSAFEPMIAATYPIPKLAIMPLILLIFGLGETSKIFTIAIGVFYLVVINTMAGVLNIDKIYLEVAKNFGASRKDFYLTVALPGALPMIFAGLKLGMGMALILIVAAEMSAAKAGVGWMIWRAYDMFDIEQMFVALITLSVLGYIFSLLLDWLEHLVLPWKQTN